MWGINIRLLFLINYSQKSNHPRIVGMKALARSYWWWPGLDKDLEAVTNFCVPRRSVKQALTVAPLSPWLRPTISLENR